MNDLSNRLRQLLTENLDQSGLAQSSLAKFLGVSPSAVSRILSGERQISATEMLGIKQFFSIPIGQFIAALDLDDEKEQDLFLTVEDGRTSYVAPSTDIAISPYDVGTSNIILPNALFINIDVSAHKNLKWMKVFDDAMAPSINRGDIVVLDTRKGGAIGLCALSTGMDKISIRRLDHAAWDQGDLIVHVAAENTKFRSYDTPLMNLKIVGEVVLKITSTI